MPSTPIAYNTGSPISGTTQTGSLAVGSTAQPYSNDIGGVKWWMGPEESTGYVIGAPVPGNNQPTQLSGVSASVGFWRSVDKTSGSFLSLTNNVFSQSITSSFTNATSASLWLTSNGYWNTYLGLQYQVGQLVFGGIIAYVLQPGDPGYDANVEHGLVVAANDISGYKQWGCDGTLISGAVSYAIGSGASNTAAIIVSCSDSQSAARACADYSVTVDGTTYDDWYLPSLDELVAINTNKVAIGMPSVGVYWSSTQQEIYGPESNATCVSFFFDSPAGSGKTAGLNVRPVRSF